MISLLGEAIIVMLRRHMIIYIQAKYLLLMLLFDFFIGDSNDCSWYQSEQILRMPLFSIVYLFNMFFELL